MFFNLVIIFPIFLRKRYFIIYMRKKAKDELDKAEVSTTLKITKLHMARASSWKPIQLST